MRDELNRHVAAAVGGDPARPLPLRWISLIKRPFPEEGTARIALGEDHLRAERVDVIERVDIIRGVNGDRDPSRRLHPIDVLRKRTQS